MDVDVKPEENGKEDPSPTPVTIPPSTAPPPLLKQASPQQPSSPLKQGPPPLQPTQQPQQPRYAINDSIFPY